MFYGNSQQARAEELYEKVKMVIFVEERQQGSKDWWNKEVGELVLRKK